MGVNFETFGIMRGPVYHPGPREAERDYVPRYHPSYTPPADSVRAGSAPPVAEPVENLLKAKRWRKSERRQYALQRKNPNVKPASTHKARIVNLLERERREWTSGEIGGRLGIVDSASTLASRLWSERRIVRRRNPSIPTQWLYRAIGVPVEGVTHD